MNTGNPRSILKTVLLAILLWLTGSSVVFPQDYIFDVEIINVEDGLPHRNTYGIVQDKEGFIWLSTLRGISRYDGYSFKNYDRSLLNIAENSVALFLAVDMENRIWYSGNNHALHSGLIDSRQDSIYTMEAVSGGRFTSRDVIYIGNSKATKDDVIIATRGGVIYNYDGDFHEIYRAPRPFPESVLCEALPDGSYWLIYSGHPDNSQNEVFRVKHDKILQRLKVDHRIKRIVTTYPELIIEMRNDPVATHRKLEKDRLVPFSVKGHNPEDIMALLQFDKNYSCYVTESELLIQDKQGNIMYTFDQFKFLDRKFTGCLETLLDRQGILWATTGNGIIKLSARKNPFKNLGITNNIRGIYRDGAQLWVHKSVTDLESGSQTALPLRQRQKESVSSFYKDRQGHLWIAPGANTIIRYIPGENRYIHYNYDGMAFFHLVFQNAVTKTYWLGTKNGLYRFDANTEKITPFALPIASKDVYIRHFHQNTKGIWIATNKGIFLMDARNETIVKHYTVADGLAVNNINYLYEDDQGIFWLGTKGGGLQRWDLTANSFRQYTRENGLSNDNIYAVYEDDYQTLWLPSDYGLMAFDKNAETAKVYLPEHGISHEEFNTFSHFKDKDGTLYFGGLKGMTSFHPRELQGQTTTSPPLYATRVQVLEKDAENYVDKTDTFKTAKKIVLNPNDRIMELELTLLDYERSGENQYAYKLSGKQEQWIYTRENKLSIINPPYGKYDLEIKARGASGSWSETPLVIPMQVKVPFYLQWWFILTVITIVITSIIIGVRWRVRKLEKDREHLKEEVAKRTAQIEQDKRKIEEDKRVIEKQAEELKILDKAKTRFFSNITHEFRTPLTLVAGPIEQMIAKPPPPATLKQKLSGVLKNTRNLMGLINQLLDLSKLEGGRMKVEISHGDIIRYTRELVGRFQPLAEKKQLQLEFVTDDKVWKIDADIDKWTKIVHNLLSNAIKFTPKGGRITVTLKQVNKSKRNCIQLKIKDSGIGIATENLEHIFNRFYQADASSTRLQGGTGIGLSLVKELVALQGGSVSVESAVGKGSEFRVILPLATAPQTGSVIPMLAPDMEPLSLEIASERKKPEVNGIVDPGGKHNEKLELLIIEDNAEMRTYIRSCIDASIYNISEAANGSAGIEKAMETVPDLIISDVMMPEKNGFEVTEAIRDHIATSHIPLILLTAKASLESRLKGLERGADAYLTKPFSPQELALRIKKLIELRKLLQQRYQDQDGPPEQSTAFKKEDTFISELKNYILDNLSEPALGVESISSHFAISRIQLYRKLRALINKPIGDYIRSIRLETALKLLKEEQLNITEIAYEIGFSSASNFSKAFKKAYGRAPSAIK